MRRGGMGRLGQAALVAAMLVGVAPALAAVAGPVGAPRRAVAAPAPAAPRQRLPDTVRPLRGALDLTVDPAAARYRGTVRYLVRLTRPASILWLHAEGLDVALATVGGRRARPVTASGGFLGLALERSAAAGELEVLVEFGGAFDQLRSRGLHAGAEGERWYAATSFRATDARRAFPCFDEPGIKIPWRLTLRVKTGDLALAGSPVTAETAEEGLTRIDFAETRPLPARLLAFVVGPFDLVDGGTAGAGRVPVRLAVPRGRGGEARYAASITARLLDGLEAALGRAGPDPTCVLAVVPGLPGSSHQPGLVLVDEALALIRPTAETRERREAYLLAAARLLAQGWYGGLVSPAWWDDLWLDRALVGWEAPAVVDRLEPGWRTLATERWSRRRDALLADALPSARRLRQPVGPRPEIEAVFEGTLARDKGASLLAMYDPFVGRERWRRVLQAHLDARAGGVATGEDLLVALSAAAGPQVAVSLKGFLDQAGVPLLAATTRCAKGGARVSFRQERFLAGGGRDRASRWTVPVCVRAGAGDREATVCGLVGGPRGELELPFCPDWLWPNAGGSGYYLTALAPVELQRVLPHLAPAEKLALTTDAGLLARRGDLPLADALELVAPLAREADRLLVGGSVELAGLVEPARLGDADRARWRAFLRRTYGERARALGWLPRPDDDDEAWALRRLLVPLVAGPAEEAVLAGEALALGGRWLADRTQVPAEVAGPALLVAARRGDRRLLDRILAEAERSGDRAEKELLIEALARFEDPGLIRRPRADAAARLPGTAAARARDQKSVAAFLSRTAAP